MKIARQKLPHAKIWSLLAVKTLHRSRTTRDVLNTNEMVKVRDLGRLDCKRYVCRPLKWQCKKSKRKQKKLNLPNNYMR